MASEAFFAFRLPHIKMCNVRALIDLLLPACRPMHGLMLRALCAGPGRLPTTRRMKCRAAREEKEEVEKSSAGQPVASLLSRILAKLHYG